jgi:hypothetical protein
MLAGDPCGGEASERVADEHDVAQIIRQHGAHGVCVLVQGRVGVVTWQVDDDDRVACGLERRQQRLDDRRGVPRSGHDDESVGSGGCLHASLPGVCQ